MRWLLILLGVILIAVAGYYAYMMGNQGMKLQGYINGVKVEAVTANESIIIDTLLGRNPQIQKVILDVPEGKSVVVKQGNITKTFGSGRHEFKPVPKAIPIELVVDNRSGVIYLGKNGELLGASFEGGLSLSVLSVSGNNVDQLKTAVLTYTVAPFLSGLFFTMAGVLVRRSSKRSSKGVW